LTFNWAVEADNMSVEQIEQVSAGRKQPQLAKAKSKLTEGQ
jgi:hypothetical protein